MNYVLDVVFEMSSGSFSRFYHPLLRGAETVILFRGGPKKPGGSEGLSAFECEALSEFQNRLWLCCNVFGGLVYIFQWFLLPKPLYK